MDDAAPGTSVRLWADFLIIVEPLGGLGNQLFVYALGLANARRLDVELAVDLWNFHGYDLRSYELGTFRNAISREITTPPRPSPTKPLLIGKKLMCRSLRREPRNLQAETIKHYDPKFLAVPDGSRLRGYFQSWKYLVSVADELRASVWELTNPSDWFSEKAEELSGAPWIGVHVRMGNYLTIPSMGVVPPIYYERAVSLLLELDDTVPIVVFSDSPQLVQEMGLWRSLPKVSFFDSGPANSPLETMLLMSLARHLVIGNSSFSWWAGWLGDRPDRKVVYPRPWVNGELHNDRELATPLWLGMSSEESRNYG